MSDKILKANRKLKRQVVNNHAYKKAWDEIKRTIKSDGYVVLAQNDIDRIEKKCGIKGRE
jgi:uncharacterized protein (DUF302 family)